MPRAVAPPPSGEFQVVLSKPFNGTPTHTITVIGEPNRAASVKTTSNGNEKTGDLPKEDVQELLSLVNALRGFPSHAESDIYGQDAKVELNTFEIQWGNGDEDVVAGEASSEIAAEQKDEFKRVVDSIEALGRQFAKQDAAV